MSSAHGSRPNIIMVIVHDLGQYLSCFGAGISTPNLDAMASDGVLFTNHFCTAAQCSPSRGSIITGRMPHNNGLIGLAHLGWEVGANEVTLPMYLNAAGYSTHLMGHQHEHPEAPRLGYQSIQHAGTARDGSQAIISFLREAAQNPPDRPFYVNSGWSEPHRPYGQDGYDNDDPAEVQPLYWLPDRPGIRQDIAGLNGLVKRVDECVGQLRAALAKSPFADNTLLVFTTDHGLAMPRAKGTCYDPGLKTTFMAHWSGHFEGGKRYDEMISNMDLLPTILDLAGATTPPQVEGKSFLPLLENRPYEPHEYLYSEMNWHDKYNPMRAIRTRQHKYIRNFGDRPLVYIPLDIYRAPAGEEMKDEYYGTRRPQEELYDLEKDPLERNNLIGDPVYAGVAEQLRAQVQGYMVETNDPLLYGDIPPTKLQRERIEEWLADN